MYISVWIQPSNQTQRVPLTDSEFKSLFVMCRAARLFLVQHTKTGENIPDGQKILPNGKNMHNGRKIFQTVVKYTNIFLFKALQNRYTQIGIFM
jgi:hypothetical protein